MFIYQANNEGIPAESNNKEDIPNVESKDSVKEEKENDKTDKKSSVRYRANIINESDVLMFRLNFFPGLVNWWVFQEAYTKRSK